MQEKSDTSKWFPTALRVTFKSLSTSSDCSCSTATSLPTWAPFSPTPALFHTLKCADLTPVSGPLHHLFPFNTLSCHFPQTPTIIQFLAPMLLSMHVLTDHLHKVAYLSQSFSTSPLYFFHCLYLKLSLCLNIVYASHQNAMAMSCHACGYTPCLTYRRCPVNICWLNGQVPAVLVSIGWAMLHNKVSTISIA